MWYIAVYPQNYKLNDFTHMFLNIFLKIKIFSNKVRPCKIQKENKAFFTHYTLTLNYFTITTQDDKPRINIGAYVKHVNDNLYILCMEIAHYPFKYDHPIRVCTSINTFNYVWLNSPHQYNIFAPNEIWNKCQFDWFPPHIYRRLKVSRSRYTSDDVIIFETT